MSGGYLWLLLAEGMPPPQIGPKAAPSVLVGGRGARASLLSSEVVG